MKNLYSIGLIFILLFYAQLSFGKVESRVLTFGVPQNVKHSSIATLSSSQGKVIRISKDRFALKTARLEDRAFKIYVATTGKGVYDSFYLRNKVMLSKLENNGMDLYRNGLLTQAQAKSLFANMTFTDSNGESNKYRIICNMVTVLKQGATSGTTLRVYSLPRDSGTLVINKYAQHHILKQVIISHIKAVNKETGDTIELPSVSLDVFLKEEIDGFEQKLSVGSLMYWASPKKSNSLIRFLPRGVIYRQEEM